jgi:hypothetical protein
METGKTTKYFKYAIGEIILVVIGILIALSINTWNQNRLNAKLEQELLSNLLSDIEIDIHNLQIFDSITSLAASSKGRIVSFFNGEQISRDSIFYYLSQINPPHNFIPTTITYDEMKNSDGFKVIQSSTLRREIAKLYNNYKNLENVDAVYNEARIALKEIRIEDFATASLSQIGLGNIRDADQVLEQIATNRRFINALETNGAFGRNLSYKETLAYVYLFKQKLQEFINQ